jgi:hypothetical protein
VPGRLLAESLQVRGKRNEMQRKLGNHEGDKQILVVSLLLKSSSFLALDLLGSGEKAHCEVS